MNLVETQHIQPGSVPNAKQVYCGLDCCLTFEVLEAMQGLQNEESIIYSFERALQAPALELMLRGFRIDEVERQKGIVLVKEKLKRLNNILQIYAHSVWGKPLNPRSHLQLKTFFYEHMQIPEIWTSTKGKRTLSMNRESLEKMEIYWHALPIVACILAYRENAKQLEVLETEVDPDGRMRTSFNIAGTTTGRWSSSQSVERTGSNVQNITPELRGMFVADKGMRLYGFDLEQAESREVGWLCGTLFDDWAYYDACVGGDLHSITARLVWPKLAWTGDLVKDRAVAEQPFYRHFSYRDMSKRGGHGCLTAGHEVLTENGWKDISKVLPEEKIACCSLAKIWFETPTAWTKHIYEGPLINWEGNSISLEMTPDHRVLSIRDQTSRKLHVNPASESPRGFIPLGRGFVGGTETVPARLIAAFQADGYQQSTNRMQFHFHKFRKKLRLQMLCNRYGYPYRTADDKVIVEGSLPKEPGPYMLGWTATCIEEFVDELKNWDGHIMETAVSIFSTNKHSLEWYQTLGRLCGIGGQIQKPTISGFGSLVYKLQQNHRLWATAEKLKCTTRRASEVVFCPTVSLGAFLVKRNGKTCVTGNSNYYGTPHTMARHLKVPKQTMEGFQQAYFTAYPGIPKWHRWVAQQLQTTQSLTTIFGRQRHFFGRPNDDATLREAIAYSPQSATADRLNLILWRVWKHMGTRVQILTQVHDALYLQAPEEMLPQDVIGEVLGHFHIPITHGFRELLVPGEAKCGWNWKNYHPTTNPNGLKKFKGTDLRERINVV